MLVVVVLLRFLQRSHASLRGCMIDLPRDRGQAAMWEVTMMFTLYVAFVNKFGAFVGKFSQRPSVA